MEELRLTFLIFGALAIAGILAHGLWTVRKKNRSKTERSRTAYLDYEPSEDDSLDSDFEPEQRAEPKLNDFDDLGLGPVRVVKPRMQPAADELDEASEPVVESPVEKTEEPVVAVKKREYPSPVVEPKPEYVAQKKPEAEANLNAMPEPPAFLLRKDGQPHRQPSEEKAAAKPHTETARPVHAETDSGQLKADPFKRKEPTLGVDPLVSAKDERKAPQVARDIPGQTVHSESSAQESPKAGLAEQARNLVKRRKTEAPKRREPSLSKAREDQMRIDFDDEPKVASAEEKPAASSETGKAVSQEVLVLNVKAPDSKPIPGAMLLPALLTLGFKFGEQDIFHRHVNSNGKGPVLFSLANMFKPGVFDIDNMETFTTQGISLFMILPIEGDPHQVFNMMHNAARKLADEFGAQVLDGRRSALTKQSLQQYVEKIREFERKRMIRKAN